MMCKKALKKFIAIFVRSLFVETPYYSNLLLWAEESSALSSNRYEWSWGNGAVGQTGIRVPNNAIATSISLHANTHKATGKIIVHLMDLQDTIAVPLYTFTILSAKDGEGSTDNSHKLELINIKIPDNAVLGFKTSSSSTAIGNARIMVELKYQMGTTLKFKGNTT